MMEKNNASIPLLYDLDGAVMEAYRLAFTVPDYLQPAYATLGFPDVNPETGWRLPVPATYVINQDGVVHSQYANGDYTRRMEPADIIAALKEIAG
jgi:peroxiredoxin